MKYLFYLEAYTFLSYDNNIVLLYNTLDGKYIKIPIDCDAGKFMKRYGSENLKCLELTKEELLSDNIMSYIQNVRDFFMGDLIQQTDDLLPFVFPFELDFKLDSVKKLRFDYSKDKVQLNCLKEITFYSNLLDDIPNSLIEPYFYSSSKKNDEISFFENFMYINKIVHSNSLILNFPGDILNFENLFALINKTCTSKIYKCIHLHYTDRYSDKMIVEARNIDCTFCLYFDELFSQRMIDIYYWIKQIKISNISCVIKFLVSSEADLILAENIMENESYVNYQIIPFYNNKNVEFFRQFIYLNEEDVLKSQISKLSIFRNQVLNSYDFGKINIFSDGDIYANCNFEKLGNIKTDTIQEIIYKELTIGESWLRIRNEVPCSECAFQWLCPSPSNYELAIGTKNLCSIAVL